MAVMGLVAASLFWTVSKYAHQSPGPTATVLVAPDGYEIVSQSKMPGFLNVTVNVPDDASPQDIAVVTHKMVSGIKGPVRVEGCNRAPLYIRNEIGFDLTWCKIIFWFHTGDPDVTPGTNIIGGA